MTDGNRLVTFSADHVARTAPREAFNSDYARENAKVLEQNGLAFTALDKDDNIIACAGIANALSGVGQAWLVPGPAINDHVLWLVRQIRAELRIAISHEYRRIQTFVAAREEFVKLAKLLGMQPEGWMRKYGPNGEDYIMFSIVNESSTDESMIVNQGER